MTDLSQVFTTTVSDHTEPLTAEAIDRMIVELRKYNPGPLMVVSPYMAANWERFERRIRHEAMKRRAEIRRERRWKKIRRRQRRAHQRKQVRGGA